LGGAKVVTRLGDKVRNLRKSKGLTLEQLGDLTDSSKSYIWELENRSPPRPSMEKITKIAAVLGVTADYLADEKESSPTPDVVDSAFFRKYQRMSEPTKEKLRRLLDIWDEDT
jgi:transcriptional regulator with XRE-family HTH domain